MRCELFPFVIICLDFEGATKHDSNETDMFLSAFRIHR